MPMGSSPKTEEIMRITAGYVAEVQAGTHPHLSDYILRYPQYAAAIADFVAYFHAVEIDIVEDMPIATSLSAVSRFALDRVQQQLMSLSAPPLVKEKIDTL